MRIAIAIIASLFFLIYAFVVLFGGFKLTDQLLGFIAFLALANSYRADAELQAYKRGR